MNRKEFTNLLLEWRKNFVNESEKVEVDKEKPDIGPEVVNINDISFTKPDFEFEWPEARKHQKDAFKDKSDWLQKANDGKVFDITKVDSSIDNTQYSKNCKEMEDEYKNLDNEKLQRVNDIFNAEPIIMPLPIIRKKDNEYRCIAGNTRLTRMGIERCKDPNFPVMVWLIDLDKN